MRTSFIRRTLISALLNVAALIIVFFSTFTTTFLDIYSTAISGLTILPGLGERKGVLLGGIMGTAAALVFPTILEYEHFLLFVGAMFCPLFGIVLADYFLIRQGALNVEDLYGKEGQYWYWKGVNLKAVVAWAIGFALYLGFSPTLMEKVLTLKMALPWALGSSLPSMILAGLIFFLLERNRLQKI